jgi:hypothetical protein
MDIVRVLRVLEYTGPRDRVEETLRRFIQGEEVYGGVTIRAATIGEFPELLIRTTDAQARQPVTEGEAERSS